MKIVVIGGSGLIGSRLVENLRARGHEAVAASPSSGVNTLTGEGLAEVLDGAQVVVDVANSPSFEDEAVLDFFRTSGTNLLAAEAAAGVGHHVALSVVGADELPESGYLRAKVAQEELIKASPVPYTIVRATQFFEFVKAIALTSMDGDTIRLPHALFQPIAAEDVSAALTDLTLEPPTNGIVEIAGPEQIPMDDAARRVLSATGDSHEVTTDDSARYFGTTIDDQSLNPRGKAHLGATRFENWLTHSTHP
ncbi:SDR family oxidoreductase [Micromonospora sp. NPDC050397]|uniref:SDR family oxidoreductase n=1 Tax=Micromonospora sp. NPDC050397 TaxID=3364279 RepID=UPI003850B67B